MKLASYTLSGGASYGVVEGDGVIDIGRRLGARASSLRAAIAADALAEIADMARGAKTDYALAEVKLLPPLPDAGKLICVGRNYKAHVGEIAGAPLPRFPRLFVRFNDTVVGHDSPITLSKLSSHYDYEGELALVIGKHGRHIPRERALEHVCGYSCFNEACFRDFQFEHSLTAGKNFAASGSFGPWLVTADEIPDPTQLELRTRLNGVEMQHARTDGMIFDIPYILAYVSGFTPLSPGDVIVTGTPEGVGFVRKPPLWMKGGDTVEVEISTIGVLRNKVVAET